MYESSVLGGVGPNSSAPGSPVSDPLLSPPGVYRGFGTSYLFWGVSGQGRAVWVPYYVDFHKSYIPFGNAKATAILASLGGVYYAEVISSQGVRLATSTQPARPGKCAIYQAGAPDWPAPGTNYVRIGTSGGTSPTQFSLGPDLPIYARYDANASDMELAIQLTRATRE